MKKLFKLFSVALISGVTSFGFASCANHNDEQIKVNRWRWLNHQNQGLASENMLLKANQKYEAIIDTSELGKWRDYFDIELSIILDGVYHQICFKNYSVSFNGENVPSENIIAWKNNSGEKVRAISFKNLPESKKT